MLLSRRLPILLSLMSLMSLCTGCVTQSLWSNLGQPTVPFMTIDGSARPGPGPRRFLVARYGTGDDARLVRVPLDSDGKPLPPFAWPADAASPSPDSIPTVTDAQRSGIEKAASPSRAGRRDSVRVLPPDSPFFSVAANDSLVLAAYKLSPDGRVHPWPLPPNTDPDHPPENLPHGVFAVLLPAERPMDPARLRARRTQAAMLTPLTVTADAAVGAAEVAAYALFFWAALDYPTPDFDDDHHHENHDGRTHSTGPHGDRHPSKEDAQPG